MTNPLKPDPKPITAARIEAAMDDLAVIMVRLGKKKAEQLMPVYERLEQELEDYRSKEAKFDAILAHGKQLKAATAKKTTKRT